VSWMRDLGCPLGHLPSGPRRTSIPQVSHTPMVATLNTPQRCQYPPFAPVSRGVRQTTERAAPSRSDPLPSLL
jgi:hypothetical protein